MEYIVDLLTNDTFFKHLPEVLLLIILACVIAKLFRVQIKTKHIKIGRQDAADLERAIIRQQINWAQTYCMSLEVPASMFVPKHIQDKYFIKYILERVFDKYTEWIIYNHITDNTAYRTCKKNEMKTLVRMFAADVNTPMPKGLEEVMDKWTDEAIDGLLNIREVYKEQHKEK